MTTLQQDRIVEMCAGLKLSRIAAEWPALAQEAAAGEASYADFLEKLLTIEVAARTERPADVAVARYAPRG